jgi:hypothetical protein
MPGMCAVQCGDSGGAAVRPVRELVFEGLAVARP